ncbi:hypothetical protein E0W68_12420 [Flavobacterium salilacus subsp. salilacus]|uniref:hypothetical protein n=1 Tax=Flavobacterium TaxID=237 RepID=UPI0010750F0B|nr:MULTISPECIES: hypothetical protein [Flavobacterium]KAF2516329.1 hypothetical protein E0W68_12420 [Flavobacterium salilacus subsp. salilacus]MBE1613861.1 hypothetical protein [Flavobacterium sp. SaA2.13]
MKQFNLLYFFILVNLISCKQNEKQNENNIIKNDTLITTQQNTISVKNENETTDLIGKYFYVCTSLDSQFVNFFNENEYYNVLFFKDEKTVVHFMNTGEWTPASEGIYDFSENNLSLEISSLTSGHSILKGKLQKLTDSNFILIDLGVSGQEIEKLKLKHFIPD